MKINRKLFSFCGGLAVAVLMAVPAAQAAPSAPEPGGKSLTAGSVRPLQKIIVKGAVAAVARDLDDATRRDLAVWAKTAGVSLGATERKFRGQRELDALADKLAADPSTGYVQAGYSEDSSSTDGAEIWMRFTKPPSQDVLDQLEKLPYVIQVQYGAPLAWKDLEQVAEALFFVVADSEETAEVVSEIDPETDGIQITYSATTGKEVDQKTLLGEALKAGVAAGLTDDIPVQVRLTEASSLQTGTEATVKGGHTLTGSTGDCTSGFTVNVNGVNGVATAMHCPNYMGYEGATGVISYRNAASPTSSGAHIDLQWHSTLSGHGTSTKFQADYGDERDVNSASNAVVGDAVCNFGIGTGFQRCSTVRSLAVCYTPDDLRFCGLASTDRYVTAGGNSGGPWYFGNVAKGYHSGYNTVDGEQRSLYTPQTRVAENLGGSVLHS
ncbi:hypothetical protein ACFY19_14175 [Streptosporangium saharense]|uniref:hypothetical protein n=1 Tax=Streptosporangium saharense TaxID=1706840 RepID=UPI0036AD1B1A